VVRFVCLSLVVVVLACSGPSPAAPDAAATQVPAGSGRPEPVRLWQDASIFKVVADLIESAQRRVLVEMYELGRSDLILSLGGRRAHGVDVRVITDPTVVPSRASAEWLDRLGVSERAYPVDDGRHQIDHVKLLIADGAALVGGMNWGARSDRNHDYALETRIGTEVGRLLAIFEQDWAFAGGRPSPLAPARSAVAQTAPGEEIRSMIEAALSAARFRVLAEIYTLTDPATIAALAAAMRRGAEVRVLLDPNQAFNLHGYVVLRAAGVDVRWYPVPRGTLLHAKVGLFDGELVLGSANWTFSGLGVNHELDIETRDPAAVSGFASRFAADWSRSSGG
jgi:phosphatidylserine/phosphatidylglycerophosphate/cardiolipin synthase-like enzyme